METYEDLATTWKATQTLLDSFDKTLSQHIFSIKFPTAWNVSVFGVSDPYFAAFEVNMEIKAKYLRENTVTHRGVLRTL